MTLLRLSRGETRTGPRRGAGRQPRPRPCLDKIVNTRYASLIALLAMNDLGGTVARDFGPQLNHGTYVGAQLGEAGLDGEPCVYVGGGTAKVALGSAAFAADWNGDLYSAIVWGKLAAAQWADGVYRRLFTVQSTADANVWTGITKGQTANQLLWERRGPAVTTVGLNKVLNIAPLDWLCVGITVDVSVPVLKAFLFTSWSGWQKIGQSGSANLVAWGANPPDDAQTAFLFAPSLPWIGWGQYGVIWNAALAEREMELVMTPEG
jgi:hypothetical protein